MTGLCRSALLAGLIIAAAPAARANALLPVACAASLGQKTPFAAQSWTITPPERAFADVAPFEINLLSRNQRRIKMTAPRIGLTLLDDGAEALLASRLYPAQRQAARVTKTAFRLRAATRPVSAIHTVMQGDAPTRLVTQINDEIAQYGFEVSTIDFAPAYYRIWERVCPRPSK